MNVVAVQLAFVIVPLAVDVHQVELINQPLSLEQLQRAINRAAVHRSLQPPRFAQ